MQLNDEVLEIVFRNEENGYSVLRMAGGITVVGIFPFVSVGQEFELHGEYVTNKKFGKQFKVTSFEVITPETPAKIKQFIGSGLITGIGPATASAIVKTFGKDTLAIMEHRPEELIVVKGISLRKAKIIGERFTEIKEMQKSVSFLQRFDISLNMAIKIFSHYKENTISQVQQNPYHLIETIDGIGFLTADKMAKELGIAYSGRFRVRAGIVYTLKQSAEVEGHTYLPLDKLLLSTIRLLKIRKDQLQPVFDEIITELCLDKYLSKADNGVALTKFYNAEKSIAAKLCLLNMTEKENEDKQATHRIEQLLNHYEQKNKITFHATQRQAIISAIQSGVSVITGGPGTGKTTIIRAILYINEAQGQTTQLLAPTGRAAKRLEETTDHVASTIHRALKIDYQDGPLDDLEKAIKSDVVIVDEVSMCDVVIMNQLLRRCLRGLKMVFVGDIDQLPSVSAGNVLADIIASGIIPVVRLTEIYRQSELSKIVPNAHAINNGQMPDIKNNSNDFFFESAQTPSEIKQKIITLVSTRLPNYINSTHARIQVLCPMKQGEAGVISLNQTLQNELNPETLEKPQYEFGDTTFRLGDRVMQIKNNYDQEWTKLGETGAGIFNGDIGTITEVNRQSGEITVQFEDGRTAIYTRADLPNLVLSYAITVHKSQGCEFDAVVIPVTSGAYMILTRNLLYTAVTRAKTLVMLVGSAENIEKMVKNTYTKQRHTMLKSFLQEAQTKVQNLTQITVSDS